MHSHDYRHPEHFRGKTVLCLGAAASGMDISIDISAYANQVGGEVSADLLIRTMKAQELAVSTWWTCELHSLGIQNYK